MHRIDGVIPVHEKDLWRLPYCVSGVRRNLREVGRLLVVTHAKNIGAVTAAMSAMGETDYDCHDEARYTNVGPTVEASAKARPGQWLLQQIVKMEAHRFVDGDHYLVLDADVVFLNPTPLFDADGRVTVACDPPRTRHASHPLALPCLSFCSVAHHLFGTEWRLHDACFVCHHMVFRVETMKAMLSTIGAEWKAALDDIARVAEIWSEYDLYAYFANTRMASSLVRRTAPWLDVPWSGGVGTALEGYLDRYRRAGVSFVALHHHHDDKLSVEECTAFANQTCARLRDSDCCGRWPLAQWLEQRKRERAGRLASAPPTYGDLVRLANPAFTRAIASLTIRYAHIRRGRGFAAATRLYEPRELSRLRIEVLELDGAFATFAADIFVPLAASGIADEARAARVMVKTSEVQKRLHALVALLLDIDAHPVCPHALAESVDALRRAFVPVSYVSLDVFDPLVTGRAVEWTALDPMRWIPFVAFLSTRLTEGAGASHLIDRLSAQCGHRRVAASTN